MLKDNHFISIYCNNDNTHAFVYGKVIAKDEQFTLLSSVSKSGTFDGFLAIQTKNIFKIESDNKYDKKMLKLMHLNKYEEKQIVIDSCDILKSLLTASKSNNSIISVELCESGCDDLVGIVQNIYADEFELLQINEYGEKDGLAILKIDAITQISLGSIDEQIIQIIMVD